MFVGRAEERARIERLFAAAGSGRGGALVVRGEAGVGKTALIERAVSAAERFRVLHAGGVESEAELPFAALHELVHPIVDLVEELPEPQSRAMRAALALELGAPADRFAVHAAALGLIAAAAADEPVLCILDDAHWLDQASADALVFAARRIEHDPVAMVFATRDPPWPFAADGLSELRLGGLADEEAKELLRAAAPSLTPRVVERLVKAAAGNPLALREFAPLAADTEDTDEPLAEAERAGFLTRGSRLELSHPLARSALYQAASPAERRSAHKALGSATRAPDRRAWHLAAAAEAPDEEVAAALEEAAAVAGERGGVAAEAAALERAARLTPDDEARARRLLRAGFAADAAGRFYRAEHLLAEAAQV